MKPMHPVRNAAGVLLSLLLPAAGCHSAPAPPAVVVPVQAVQVVRQSISQRVEGDAVLSPVAQAAISARITAPVRKFYVQRGSKVKEGQLLAVLENQDLAAATLDSKGAYDQAQAAYRTATRASIPEDYQKAQLDEAQAKAALDLAQQVYRSRAELFRQGAIPGRDLDTARAGLLQAQSAYDIARTHLNSMNQVSRDDALKSARGQLISAQGKYEGSKVQLSYTEIRSPIDGVVTERPLFAGETSPAGTPLLTVMDVSFLLAKTHLPQKEALQIKVGQQADIQAAGMVEPVTGVVTMVSPALDPGSTTIEVWVKVANADGRLKAGTPVHLSITGGTVANALVIPQEAVQTGPSGKQTVMVIGGDGVAHVRPIESGILDRGLVQVTGGLKAGEKIVTDGSYAMDDGTKVEIVPARPADGDTGPGTSGGKD